QNGGLTYNVRIGTTPGGIDIKSAMANLSNGFRLVPLMGNAGEALVCTAGKLKPGIYYWSVQAVDNSFVGSAFAPEHVFSVGAGVPNIASVLLSNLALESVTLNANVNPNSGGTVVWFQYGLTTNYNVASPQHSIGSGIDWVPASATLSGLLPASVYHY